MFANSSRDANRMALDPGQRVTSGRDQTCKHKSLEYCYRMIHSRRSAENIGHFAQT